MATDVTEQTFESAVIDRSRELPVVVDFWAEWCGPCRSLGPVLEAAVADRKGAVELVKVDTEANQGLAMAFDIRGIPAVKAFRNGQVVEEFTGALPRAAVDAFLDKLVPSEAEELVRSGDEESLRRALELEPTRADAALSLAHILRRRGEIDEALAVLRNVTGSFAAEGMALRMELRDSPVLADSLAALDAGETQRGLDGLLAAISSSDGDHRDEIRKIVVGVLEELGVDHPLARETRRKLAAALY